MDLLCLDFVNSVFRDFRGRWVRDNLQNPEWFAQFLHKWHLAVEQPADEAVLTELIDLRTLLLRAIEAVDERDAVDSQDLALLNALLSKKAFSYQIERVGGEYRLESVPALHDWNWVQSEIIVDFITLLIDHEPERLKICQNPYCRSVFYDETKSRTQLYCFNKCANLTKLRRFRAKQKTNT